MELTRLIKHPEELNRETLYDLRSLLALYPYYQTARLLMLKNLYLLHDPSFNEELNRAAIYITDRKVIFQMIEAAHYQLKTKKEKQQQEHEQKESRTVDLIDNFLDTVPTIDEEDKKEKKRKPTPADAAVDYVAYLLESEQETDVDENVEQDTEGKTGETSRTLDLIDTFIEDGGFKLPKLDTSETPAESPTVVTESVEDASSGIFTETLAQIYIKQAKYQKAFDTIEKLNSCHPHKSAYYKDQMRFLEKLIKNSNNK